METTPTDGRLSELSQLITPVGYLIKLKTSGNKESFPCEIAMVLPTDFAEMFVKRCSVISNHYFGRDNLADIRALLICDEERLVYFFNKKGLPLIFDSANQLLPRSLYIPRYSALRLHVVLSKEKGGIIPFCDAIQIVKLASSESPFTEFKNGFVFG